MKSHTHNLHWHAGLISLIIFGLIGVQIVLAAKSGNDSIALESLTKQRLEIRPTANGLAEIKFIQPTESAPDLGELNATNLGRTANLEFSFE